MSWNRSLSIRARITLGSVLIALIAVSSGAAILYRQIEAITHDAEVALAKADLASIVIRHSLRPRQRSG